MISDGENRYDQNIFYLEIMNLTEPKFQEIINGEETFLEKGKLKIIPGIDKVQQKKDIELELAAATNIVQIKQVLKKIINL